MESRLEIIDIKSLVDNNPISCINTGYEDKLLSKIKEKFSEEEQHVFLASFYCYLNYDEEKDFVIDFETVWKWTGFTRKDNAKKVLTKNFTENIDYKVSLQSQENPLEGGGPKEDILLSVKTFKKFCLKSNTKKAEEIHDYFIKLEKIIQETIYEQAKDLSIQLKNKEDMNMDLIEKQRKLEEAHKRIIYKRTRHKLRKGKCLYVLQTKDNENNCRYKFGISSSLTSRVASYNTYGLNDFIFIIFTHINILNSILICDFFNILT